MPIPSAEVHANELARRLALWDEIGAGFGQIAGGFSRIIRALKIYHLGSVEPIPHLSSAKIQ